MINKYDIIRRRRGGNFTKSKYQNISSLGYSLLENHICTYKIVRNCGKFDLFSWYFFLLENLMCSNEILDTISWKIWSVLMKRIIYNVFSWKLHRFSYYIQASWKIWCVLEISLKSHSWKKRTVIYFSKIAQRLRRAFTVMVFTACTQCTYWLVIRSWKASTYFYN